MTKKNRPYGLLARHYDALTAYAPKMNAHARRAMLGEILDEARTVCDLACGSGATSVQLAEEGKRVFAVDFAPEFCRSLRTKARARKLDITVIEGDMRRFRLPEPVDLVVCEFSAVNNLDDRRGLDAVFAAVSRALVPGGAFLFDVNTMQSFATQVSGTHWFATRQFKLTLRGTLEDRGRRARLEFEWFVPKKKLFEYAHEVVYNVGWTDAEIRRALKKAGLALVTTRDGMDVRPQVDGAERGMDQYYLATKPRPRAKSRRAR
jgi:SAM-dependent methyltransferase